MYRKVLISGMTAAAIVGAGGTALALSGSDSTTTSGSAATAPATSAPSADHGHQGRHGLNGQRAGKLLRRMAHGEFVVKGKDGKFETHQVILGTVTAVSATSITVQAADKTFETFSVTKDTKVRVRQDGRGVATTIGKVAKGDDVLVAGVGAAKPVANHIIDVR